MPPNADTPLKKLHSMTDLPRIILIGDTQVGKTSLIRRFLGDEIDHYEKATIGTSVYNYKVESGGHTLTVQIWDTAGQERFRSLGPIYYRGARAALAVFDVTRRDTMLSLKDWIRTFEEHTDDAVVVIVGNKCDLEASIEVSVEEGNHFASEMGADCIRTSAHTGMGVSDVFTTVVKGIADTYIQCDEGNAVQCLENEAPKSKKGCC